MNSDIFKGKWLQIRGAIKERWGDLTDDDLTQVDGNLDRLAGILQERYGYTRERVQEEIDRFNSDGGFGEMGDSDYNHPHM